ncbi:hypothetical protein [Streptomyces sp. NPDC048248]|uniref:hypothetical protein n=1 Tax=Streptomyces sp. NPDC048248 TaxID=3365523 RepID=UPI00371549F6
MTAAPTPAPRCATEPEKVIVEIVGAVETHLLPATIEAVLLATVKSRPARRHLAQALHQCPDLLTSGHPAGPRTIEKLISALRGHGAVHLKAPQCARCGAQRPLEARMGELRICLYCSGRRAAAAKPCVICGSKGFAVRDREGKPRCASHPPDPGRDVLGELVERIAQVATDLPGPAITDAVVSVARTRHPQLRLLWAMEDHPGLLTGTGAAGPASTQRLIQALQDRGATGLALARCSVCKRSTALTHVHDGMRCCRTCHSAMRPETCSRCGRSRPVAGRCLEGKPLCQGCRRADPLNHDTCSQCGTTAHVIARTEAGAICPRCYQLPTALCTLCGRTRPCLGARTDHARCMSCTTQARPPRQCSRCGDIKRIDYRGPAGEALCKPCGAPRPCSRCHKLRHIHRRTPQGERLCTTCWRKHPDAQRPCTNCATIERLHHHGLCHRCAAHRRLTTILGGPDQTVPPALQPVLHAMLRTPPATLLRSLLPYRSTHTLLTQLAALPGPVTHTALDHLTPAKAVKALRAQLVAAGALPDRDEHLATLEKWLTKTLARVPSPHDRLILRSYATFTHLRRLRRLTHNKKITYGQITGVKHEIANSVRLTEWLHQHHTTLAHCTQDHLDAWLAEGPAHRNLVRAFLKYTARRHHTAPLHTPLPPTDFTLNFIAQDRRWAMVQRLIHDETLHIVDRTAGLLTLLYAQPASRLTQLTTNHLTHNGHTTHLTLGTTPTTLPPPLDHLIHQLTHHKGHAATPHTDPQWLFPGGHTGHPLSPTHLNHRLKTIGIPPKLSRHTALIDIASQLPAPLITHLLGYHPHTAALWQHHTTHPNPTYATHLHHRHTTPTNPFRTP